MPDPVELRERMVQTQLVERGIGDPRVLDAMRAVPRERFVSRRLEHLAYSDAPLPIPEGQTISQPYVVAMMIEAAEVGPDDRVLEVGSGSGYSAAVLGRIASEVFAIERHPSLVEKARTRLAELGATNVHVRSGDGTLGWPEQAPYDAIVVSAGGPEVPESLLGQLAVRGRLVIPIGDEPRRQELVRIRRVDEQRFERASLGAVRFVPLVGHEGWSPAER